MLFGDQQGFKVIVFVEEPRDYTSGGHTEQKSEVYVGTLVNVAKKTVSACSKEARSQGKVGDRNLNS